ncbi:Hypothetical predicted protein [Cloeon dipterum]|nr:Hypothetical predicted protein [Cloeon dipterum]
MDFGSAIDAVGRASKRSKIGRKLSRRLSMVAKVPSLIQNKFRTSDNQQHQGGRSRSSSMRHVSRTFEISIIAPDKTQRLVAARSGDFIHNLVSPILNEFQLVADSHGPAPYERSPDHPNGTPVGTKYTLLLAGSRAVVDKQVDVSCLEGDILLIETKPSHSFQAALDPRLYLAEELLWSEKEFCEALASATELYGKPLQRIGCLNAFEQDLIFGTLQDFQRESLQRCLELERCLKSWNPETTTLGHLFSKQFWLQQEEYQDVYRKMKE